MDQFDLDEYIETESEIDANSALERAKDYCATGKRAVGLKKYLDEDWFISKLYSWIETAPDIKVKMDALIRLGQLIHGYFKPFDKSQPQVADITINEIPSDKGLEDA